MQVRPRYRETYFERRHGLASIFGHDKNMRDRVERRSNAAEQIYMNGRHKRRARLELGAFYTPRRRGRPQATSMMRHQPLGACAA